MSDLRVETNGTCETFARLFRLDWNVEEIRQQILEAGPEIAPYLGAMCGLRLMRPSDPVETFFSFLCTPNNNIPRITGMVRHLASLGDFIGEVEGHRLHRFPSASTIASTPEADLRAKGFGYRAATIPKAAAELEARGGVAYLDGLKHLPFERARQELVSFSGIGPKLADCIALFALDHSEAVPLDTHLWQAATRLYFPEWQGGAITPKKYEEASRRIRTRFGPLAGWVQQCLFYDNVLNWRNRK